MIKYRELHYPVLESTNLEAKRLARLGYEEGTLVIAEKQTGGYGKQGRQWFSPEGNVYASLILKPQKTLMETAQLSFVGCVALGHVLQEILPPYQHIGYKWPNDVLINYAKVSGVLLESETSSDQTLEWVVIGIGLNVENSPQNLPYKTTHLLKEGAAYTRPQVIEHLKTVFAYFYDMWNTKGFSLIRDLWHEKALGLHEKKIITIGNQEEIVIMEGLDKDGGLQMTQEGLYKEHKTLYAGDIFFKEQKVIQ
jgi:BirA family transcriptional regulator, biotin operon repressor / biotin---[acetyl-CoA-carboxylase] ligase